MNGPPPVTIEIEGSAAAVASSLRRLAMEARVRQEWPYLPESPSEARDVMRWFEAEISVALCHLGKVLPRAVLFDAQARSE